MTCWEHEIRGLLSIHFSKVDTQSGNRSSGVSFPYLWSEPTMSLKRQNKLKLAPGIPIYGKNILQFPDIWTCVSGRTGTYLCSSTVSYHCPTDNTALFQTLYLKIGRYGTKNVLVSGTWSIPFHSLQKRLLKFNLNILFTYCTK